MRRLGHHQRDIQQQTVPEAEVVTAQEGQVGDPRGILRMILQKEPKWPRVFIESGTIDHRAPVLPDAERLDETHVNPHFPYSFNA